MLRSSLMETPCLQNEVRKPSKHAMDERSSRKIFTLHIHSIVWLEIYYLLPSWTLEGKRREDRHRGNPYTRYSPE